jgi:hypothetical protein
MQNDREAEKPINLIHKTNGCEGALVISTLGTLNGILLVHCLCRKCNASVVWEKSLQELVDESPRTSSSQLLLTEEEIRTSNWCEQLYDLPSEK